VCACVRVVDGARYRNKSGIRQISRHVPNRIAWNQTPVFEQLQRAFIAMERDFQTYDRVGILHVYHSLISLG